MRPEKPSTKKGMFSFLSNPFARFFKKSEEIVVRQPVLNTPVNVVPEPQNLVEAIEQLKVQKLLGLDFSKTMKFAQQLTDPAAKFDLMTESRTGGNTILHDLVQIGEKFPHRRTEILNIIKVLLTGLEQSQIFDLFNIQNRVGNTVIHEACAMKGEKSVACNLLESVDEGQRKFLMNKPNGDSKNVLHVLVARPPIKEVMALCNFHVTEKTELLEKLDTRSNNVLHFAMAAENNGENIRWLLEGVSDVSTLLSVTNKSGFTPLFNAVQSARIDNLIVGLEALKPDDLDKDEQESHASTTKRRLSLKSVSHSSLPSLMHSAVLLAEEQVIDTLLEHLAKEDIVWMLTFKAEKKELKPGEVDKRGPNDVSKMVEDLTPAQFAEKLGHKDIDKKLREKLAHIIAEESPSTSPATIISGMGINGDDQKRDLYF